VVSLGSPATVSDDGDNVFSMKTGDFRLK